MVVDDGWDDGYIHSGPEYGEFVGGGEEKERQSDTERDRLLSIRQKRKNF